MSFGCSGLIIGDTVYLNRNPSYEELIATIVEEIDHYGTSPN